MTIETSRAAATIEEVAAVAGVSRSTVSRVVNGSTAVSPAALAAVQKAMRRGLGQLIIYPEGTRTKPGERRPWRGGVAALYAAAGLPCQPVATNAGMFWPRDGMRIRPGVAVIEFLEPVAPGLPSAGLLPRIEPLVETASDRLMADAGLAIPPR